MRIKYLPLYIVFVICAAAFSAYYFIGKYTSDTLPPVITASPDSITVSIHDGDDVLLDGITALDDRDGDLTGSVIVESISKFINAAENKCTATYAVADSSGNVAKYSRTLYYSDYTRPRFKLSSPLIYSTAVSVEPLSSATASDCIDGDITRRLRVDIISDDSYSKGAGEYQIELSVSNSMGLTESLELNVLIYDSTIYNQAGMYIITLSDYLVYIEQGDSFTPESYVSYLNIYGEKILAADIDKGELIIDSGELNTDEPGLYTVTYKFADKNIMSPGTRLFVVVEDVG